MRMAYLRSCTDCRTTTTVKGMILSALLLSFAAQTTQETQPLWTPDFFSSGMVLQCDRPIRIWGQGTPGTRVHATIVAHQDSAQTIAAAHGTIARDGSWSLTLPPQEASWHSFRIDINSSSGIRSWQHVLFGEVWFAAGQSNMEWPLSQSASWEKVQASRGTNTKLADAMNAVRFYDARFAATGTGGAWSQETVSALAPESFRKPDRWRRSTLEDLAGVSAVAWFFAAELATTLECPIGLIEVAAGGTPTEAWVDPQALAANPATAALVADGNWLDNPLLGEWCRGRARQNLSQAIEEGWQVPGNALGPHHAFQPGHMWQTAVEPFTGLPIRGVIWYQGESNADSAERVIQHNAIFRGLVSSWRKAWKQPELPFLFVQLPNMNREHWPAFREQQRQLSSSIAHTGMAVTVDVGNPNDVHPRRKQPVGERLSRWAFNLVYERPRLTGPSAWQARLNESDSSLRLSFQQVGSGLQLNGDAMNFEWLDSEGQWHSVLEQRAELVQVHLGVPPGSRPKAVRYAWAMNPSPTVFCSDGLPASPFVIQVSD